MFGRWLRSSAAATEPEGAEALAHQVGKHLPDADDDTVRVVTAITGLLGVIAYADRDYSASEETRVRRELSRIHGMTDVGIEAIAEALRQNILEISTVQMPRYARTLVELADRELRAEVLEVLVDLSAADGVISNDEVKLLRTVTQALGLTQQDYNAAQHRHRDKLSALKPR
ncbi:MAG: TerB family tellurite resistance protein [Polyangiaceae bacterium]